MIAILYPLKMEKNLSEAYSTIYESSLSSGSSDGNYHDVGGGDYRSKDQIVRMNNDPKGTKKYGRRMMKNVGKVLTDLKVPTVRKQGESLEPEMDMVEGAMSADKYTHNTGGFTVSQKEADEAAERLRKKHKDRKTIHGKVKKMNNSYEPEGEVIDEMRFNDGKEGTAKRKEALRKKRGLTKDQMDKHPQFKTEGKYRKEWEALKLIETENYREQFDIWLESIAEEGYDIERWSDYELIDTFINENDLWDSRDAIDEALLSEADKKGKGSGKKDACYHKVKASASVWPSAYASGRLVQCRKKGASNYGNSTKKEGFSDWRDDLQVITEKDKPYGAGSEEAKKKGASSYTRGERIYNRSREYAQHRYKNNPGSGVGQNERAGYNLARTLQGANRNKDLSTQGGPQTGGNQSSPHSLGGFVTPRAQTKSYSGTKDNPGKGNPIKKKSPMGDTGSHQRKADTKRTTKKDGKTPLKNPVFKYNPDQRANIGDEGRSKRKDPKKNPLHQKNTGVVKNPEKQTRKEKVKAAMSKEEYAAWLAAPTLVEKYLIEQEAMKPKVKNFGKQFSIPLPNIKSLGPLNPRNFKINAVGPEKDGGITKGNPIKGTINRLGYTDQGKNNPVIKNVEKAKKVIPSAISKVDKLNKMADKLPGKVKTGAKIALAGGAAVLGAKALMDRNKKKREERKIRREVRKQMAYAHHEPEGEMIDEKVGGKGTLVRQGIKLFGKKGGRKVQQGQAAALAAGQGAKDAAKQPNKDKMVGSGTGEKIGSVVGTVGGSLAGGVLDGPLPIGDIAGGIAGGALGGKIGRQFDKIAQKPKPKPIVTSTSIKTAKMVPPTKKKESAMGLARR